MLTITGSEENIDWTRIKSASTDQPATMTDNLNKHSQARTNHMLPTDKTVCCVLHYSLATTHVPRHVQARHTNG